MKSQSALCQSIFHQRVRHRRNPANARVARVPAARTLFHPRCSLSSYPRTSSHRPNEQRWKDTLHDQPRLVWPFVVKCSGSNFSRRTALFLRAPDEGAPRSGTTARRGGEQRREPGNERSEQFPLPRGAKSGRGHRVPATPRNAPAVAPGSPARGAITGAARKEWGRHRRQEEKPGRAYPEPEPQPAAEMRRLKTQLQPLEIIGAKPQPRQGNERLKDGQFEYVAGRAHEDAQQVQRSTERRASSQSVASCIAATAANSVA